MRTMSKHPFRLASLLLFAVCATGSLSTPVAASTPCSTTHPSAREESELRAVVRKTAGAQTARLMIQDFCSHVVTATADLHSPFKRQRQDVREWSTIHCQREDPHGWVCDELVTHRAVKVRAVLAGSKRTIDVEFLPELPVETARELALRALSVVEDPAAEPAKCVGSESHPVFFEHSQWQDARNALLKAITGLPLSVAVRTADDTAAGTPQVWLDGTLGIEFPPGCWMEAELILVT
jgi:hypothetical protein